MLRKWFLLGIVFISFGGQGQGFQLKEVIPDNTYDEIADRMSCIEKEVPLVFNERVMAFVDYFAIKDREYTKDIIRKKELYFPLFSETLAKYNMPDELKYLAIVESGLRPNAISRANAVGLWQFISSTGKMYGLQSNWYVDDRMDPEEATDAAARHLRDLYNMFDSWELALAAYNCGPGNVRKAIRRSGYKREFWDIYRYLPRAIVRISAPGSVHVGRTAATGTLIRPSNAPSGMVTWCDQYLQQRRPSMPRPL